MKRDVGIAYIAMRKIHYNVMRFRDTVSLDEAEVLAGRFKSVSARYYVLHDPEKLTDKYVTAWSNFGIDVSHTSYIEVQYMPLEQLMVHNYNKRFHSNRTIAKGHTR